MSREGAATPQRERCKHANCLQKPPGEPAVQQQIAYANLLNSASVVMTRLFSTAC